MLKRVLGLAAVLGFAVVSAALVGCPSQPTTPDPTPPPPTGTGVVLAPPASGAPASGKPCKANAECAAGEICDFAPGCDTPGMCNAQHPCTRDLVTFCGCNGTNFQGSSTCPDRPFAHRGGCDLGPPPAPGTKKACNSDADCATGEQCQGDEGCGAPWTCGPPKRCTRDNVEWCACDGTTFRGSGTCPSKPVRKRGKC
jgi:hypothetical protein